MAKLRFSKRSKKFYKLVSSFRSTHLKMSLIRDKVINLKLRRSPHESTDDAAALNVFLDAFIRSETDRLGIEGYEVTWGKVEVPSYYIKVIRLDVNDMNSLVKFTEKSSGDQYEFIIRDEYLYVNKDISKGNIRNITDKVFFGIISKWLV